MAKSVKPQAAPGRAAGTTARPAVEPGVEACGNGERGGPPRRVGPPGVDACDLARLMTWLSPAFSYSHALEWVVEAGTIQDAAALGDWIADVLVYGAGRSDAIFLAQAWRAVAAADARRLAEVASLAAAFAISAERRLETLAQGTAFLGAVMAVWPHPALKGLTQSSEIAYPVAVGACTAAHQLPLLASAQAFTQAFAANLVSAGVRLVPLGQTDGLRLQARLEPLIAEVVRAALAAGLEDVGGAAVLVDIASMRHQTQYTRLFRS